MQHLKKLVMVVFVTAACLLTGCASVPTASPEFQQKALSFTPPPGMASVYVYRPYNFVGSAVAWSISLDFKEFGSLGLETYLFGNVDPGPHILKGFPFSGAERTKFDAEAGKLYFFKVTPGMAGLDFDPVEEKEGREKVSNWTLSGDNVFEWEDKTQE